jgi:drug/metabolite transporter (DMT)-like permease
MKRPMLALMLAALLWGGAVTGTKYALGGFGPVTLLAVELTAAAAVLWAVTLVRGYRPPRRWWVPVLLGLLEPAVAYLAETAGLSMTSAVSGAVITGLESALVVTLAGLLLRERVTPAAAGAVAVAVAGLLVLARAGGGGALGGRTSVTGDLLMAAGVLSAALYTIAARRFSDGSDVLSLTAWQFTVAAAVALPAAVTRLASGAETGLPGVPARFWLAAVLVGVAGYGLSFLLFNRAIGETEAGWAAIVLNLIPVFGFLSAVVFLGEQVSPGEAGGAALVGASVLYFTLAERRAVPEPAGSAGERVGVGAHPQAPVQRGDHLVVVGGELEVEDVDVLPHPGRGDRLGEHDVAALDVPAQHDLGRGLAGPLGDRHDLRVAEKIAPAGQR